MQAGDLKVVWREYKAGADPRTNLALLLFHRPLRKFHVEPTTCAAVALQFGQVLTSSSILRGRGCGGNERGLQVCKTATGTVNEIITS